MLGGLLLPYAALAAGAAEDPLVTKCKSKVDEAKTKNINAGKLCLSDAEVKNNIFTVLEESMDTPGTEPGSGTPGEARACIRYTEILSCDAKGGGVKKITNQLLLKECPKGVPDLGTDESGQYFDCQGVTVLLIDPAQGGTGLLQLYLGLIYRWAAGIVGVIAVLTIVISGIQISVAKGEGEPSVVGEAKGRIVQAIGGIALLFFASALLYVINPTFFQAPDYSGQNPPTEVTKDGEEPTSSNIKDAPADPNALPDGAT